MKNTITQNQSWTSYGINRFRIVKLVVIFVTILMTSSCIAPAYMGGAVAGNNIVPPPWAPAYENTGQVRYYYLPDIESYYDVFNHEFIYMDNGSWMFSSTLPAMYSWYDLGLGFTVLLNYRVHQPWMHFNYYVSNYPRYYYQSIYRDSYRQADHPLRGFNENTRSVVYHNSNPNNSTRTNNVGSPTRINNSGNNNGPVNNSTANGNGIRNNNSTRQLAGSTNAGQNKSAAISHSPQRMNYFGKHIGRPVKVTRKMSGGHGGKHGRN